MSVRVETRNRVCVVTIDRPERRNAVDGATASSLYRVFKDFDQNAELDVAILTGADGNFCAGADLKALSEGDQRPLQVDGELGPMGPTRLNMSKPVIAAVEGYAVAGGLELALWCDLRVAASDAKFGVFCRRFGVPLIDLGTIRLPRLIGQSRAMDMILTGREVDAIEAERFGLVNRVCEPGQVLDKAMELALNLCKLPQQCLRNDRLSTLEQWSLDWPEAIAREMTLGLQTFNSGETLDGAGAFATGAGRHGKPG